MKLKNNGSKFEIMYDGNDYTIPEGEFEINSVGFGYHIINKSTLWGLNVVISDDTGVKVGGTEIGIVKKEEIKTSGATSETLPTMSPKTEKVVEEAIEIKEEVKKDKKK